MWAEFDSKFDWFAKNQRTTTAGEDWILRANTAKLIRIWFHTYLCKIELTASENTAYRRHNSRRLISSVIDCFWPETSSQKQ